MTQRCRRISIAYALIFTVAGALIMGALLHVGWAPLVLVAAGAFMLVGPAILAGFFGIAQASERGEVANFAAIGQGFGRADSSLWVLSLICGLLFMIFVTDAAILYSYMVGAEPVWLRDILPPGVGVARFLRWACISGAFIALMLFSVSAFAVPLLCEQRCGLVEAVVTSVRAVFGNLPMSIFWAVLLSTVIISSIIVLPLLLLSLPWLAFASRALYREVLPG